MDADLLTGRNDVYLADIQGQTWEIRASSKQDLLETIKRLEKPIQDIDLQLAPYNVRVKA